MKSQSGSTWVVCDFVTGELKMAEIRLADAA
jgi:hypothetical protein